MKTLTYLKICLAVCCLFNVNVFALCSGVSLNDDFLPSGKAYLEGETIEYTLSLEITNATSCPITDIVVRFFPPNDPPTNTGDICGDTVNGTEIFNGGSLTLSFGDPAIELDSSVLGAEALAYVVNASDADASNFLKAYICTSYTVKTDIGDLEASDEKPSINLLLAPDFTVDKACVNPSGTLIGEDAVFKVTITNTGTTPLTFYDIGTELDAYEPIVLPPASAAPANVFDANVVISTEGECEDDLNVPNTVEVAAFLESDPNTAFDVKSDSADCPVICPPSFTVEKTCLLTEPITDEPNAIFQIVITNTGYVPLEFEIDDVAAGIENLIVGPVAPDANYVMTVEVPAECLNGAVSNRVVVQAYFDSEPVLDPMPAEAICPCGGLEGCTPGYWKNSTSCWGCYSTTTKLNQVFDFPGSPAKLVTLGNTSLLDALKLPGGKSKIEKAQILMRHAVAAVLNACNGDVDYPDDVAGIVDAVNDILANWSTVTGKDILSLKNQYVEWNELGCPISSENSANPCSPNNGY